MFVYLSKKIAMPNSVPLRAVAWNPEQGWVACGGDGGMLKVLKLENMPASTAGGGTASVLTMNQTLEGHAGSVQRITWNANCRKLTTADATGKITVWMLHKKLWYEEMVNNRNKSVVKDMRWTADGQKICIAYEDGVVIVGAVDGNRLWGQDLNVRLEHVEWSPDGRFILFVTMEGRVLQYNHLGNRISEMELFETDRGAEIVGIHWYDGSEGYLDPKAPSLALAFSTGKVQLTRGTLDTEPIIIDTGMEMRRVCWNTNGTVLGVAGMQRVGAEQRSNAAVQFYNPYGYFLRKLKVPGEQLSDISWEGGGLRLALAVDSFIFFANVRSAYKWAYFSDTVVYQFTKPGPEPCVMFWNTTSDERVIKKLAALQIAGAGEMCAIASEAMDGEQYIVTLYNTIGLPIEHRYLDLRPTMMVMSTTHVVCASEDEVLVWPYASGRKAGELPGRPGKEVRLRLQGADVGEPRSGMSQDSITALAVNRTHLAVARASGTVLLYNVMSLVIERRYVLRCRPQLMKLNCDSTRLSVIDVSGMLTVYDVSPHSDSSALTIEAMYPERRDVWDMVWADDNPTQFAVMEKTRMYVLRDDKAEEPVLSNGYLCRFKDLEIKTLMLDEIMMIPESPERDYLIDFATRSLRDAQELMRVGLSELAQFVDDNQHPRLWKLLALAALEAMDFGVAEKAFAMLADYPSLCFMKKLRSMVDTEMQRAEVDLYFQRFDEADEAYIGMDRKDLVVALHGRLGDWFRVASMVQAEQGDDMLLELAWNNIAEYYAARQKWQRAAQYYKQANNWKALAEVLYKLEDYAGLNELLGMLPEGDVLLPSIGQQFLLVGCCEEAARAFIRAGDVKAAVDTCVMLNHWDRALALAEEHGFPQVDALLARYAAHLLGRGTSTSMFAAIRLFSRAGRYGQAAKLLAELAVQQGAELSNPVRAKQLAVLAALEVEKLRKKVFDAQATSIRGAKTTAAATARTLDTLMEAGDSMGGRGRAKVLDNAWHTAEALHFWLLAHRQLYNGEVDRAMRTALLLPVYEDVLPKLHIHSLIALSALFNNQFATCSRAFMLLESASEFAERDRAAYSELAMSIYRVHEPRDSATSRATHCDSCSAPVTDGAKGCTQCGAKTVHCVASGRVITDKSAAIMCRVCKHYALERELARSTVCPLCHALRE